jgi:hypothetical protein
MKKLLFALFFIPLFGITQTEDWHPFPEGQTAFFAIIPDASSDIKYSNIKTLRIDSIRNLSGDDYYYNMRSPVRIEFDGEYSYYDPYSSWIGKYIKLYPSKCYFADFLGNEYGIEFLRNEESPYLCCEFEGIGYLYAHTSNIEYAEILDGVMDSVKYISFQLYEDYMQNPVYHFIQEKQIILSKNNGIIQTFDFGNMEGLQDDIEEKNLIGIEKGEDSWGFKWNFDEMVITYEIGSEFQIQQFDYEQYYLSHKELSDDKVVYTYQKCNNAQNPTIEEIFKVFRFGKYPGQSLFSGGRGMISYSLYKDEVYGRKTYGVRYYNYMEEDYFQNQYVWKKEFVVTMNGIIPPYKQANEIGEFTFRNHFENPPFEMIYYKTNSEEWGQPYNFMCGVGINEYLNSDYAPSPNPTTGIIHLSIEKIEEVKIFNTNGQLIKIVNEIEGGVLDLIELENGVYIIELTTQNQQINRQKVIINK